MRVCREYLLWGQRRVCVCVCEGERGAVLALPMSVFGSM